MRGGARTWCGLTDSERAWARRGELAKGVAVPGTGRKLKYMCDAKAGKPSGLLSAERLLPHQYADEGAKGKKFRRTMRRLSKRAWVAELEF